MLNYKETINRLTEVNDLSVKTKEKINQYAQDIFDSVSKKHSFSYLADLADNFLIERGVNLTQKVRENGEKVYQYTIKSHGEEKKIILNNKTELSYLGKQLFKIIYEKKDKKEQQEKRKIIL